MKKTLTMAKFTFIEVYRSKLMMSLFLIGLGLIVISYVASEFAYGAPAKIALDVGFGVMSLSNVIIAILIGAGLISKEVEQRTLYMVISKPISRTAFLFGKIMGLSSVLVINTIVLGTISSLLYLMYGGDFSSLFLWTMYFSYIEALIVLLFAVLFSLITNTTLSVIYSICLYIVGHAINETSKILFAKTSEFFSVILKFSFFIVPNFYRLNLKDYLLYKQTVPFEYLLTTNGYILLYAGALGFLLNYIFVNKNLD